MNWFNLKLSLMVILLTSCFVAAEDDHNSNVNVEEELVPSEQTVDTNDVPIVKKKFVAKPVGKLKQSLLPNLSRNIGPNTGFQLARGLIQAPLVGQPLDAQASSASNNVLLVLNNDKNKFADFAKPAEESLRRFTRNPDVVEDIVGQFHSLGGGVAQQLLQQVTQSAPDMSRSFGQALNEALQHTSTLAQTSPGNLDISQLAQTLSQSNLPGNIDFGQLGQSLSQSFIVGAAQNLLNPAAGQAAPDAGAAAEAAAEEAGAAESEADAVVGAAAEAEPEPEPEPAAAEPEEPAASDAPKNPFDQIVGSALLPPLGLGLPPALPALPLGMLGPLSAWNPLMPLGSEISEVRVMPDQYSPYKISPKQVDHQTLAEMKLKAVLKDALDKKTIPILWFHLPNNHHLHKSTEDLEMEAKLAIFEKQVINELKQLQELAKLANEVKKAQLESGVQPTTTLTTKLNLYEIPIYDITLGDIEKTLKDEHVIMLMHTIVQKQHKEFHRHHQATTKYLTDLTGTPIKRQTKTAEEALKTMEKDDMLKMMTYAYRMAAANGHEMPWIKNEKITGLDGKESNKKDETVTSQQRQSVDGNTQMKDERQWLEDKQRQMAMEAEKQKQMSDERKQKVAQNQVRQWADSQMTQQPIERQWANPNMMPTQMPLQRQMIPPQIQQSMPIQNQMFDPNMQRQQQDNIQRQMMQQQMFNLQPQMPMQRQWLQPTNMAQQQQPIMINPMMQRQWADPNMQQQQQQLPIQRQWADMPETKSSIKTEQMPEQRQSADTKMPEQPTSFKTEKQPEQRQWADPSGTLKNPNQQPEQRQWIDTKIAEQTATKTNEPTMTQRQWADANKPQTAERMDSMPVLGEAKPQMPENAGQARHKGMEDLFSEFDVFDHGKHKEKEAAKPTIINYYYNTGGSRYPPIYAQPPPPPPPAAAPPPPSYGYGGGYARPPPPPPQSYAVAPQYKPAAASNYGGVAHGSNAYGSYGGYRTATGDEEIAAMLQQHQSMPKLMLRIPTNDEPIPAITTTTTTTTSNSKTATENDINNAEDPHKIHAKRLAHKQIQLDAEPAAYIVVIRNNTSKSGIRSRRKRSTEYATLEPIDENSLNALRKTYKNSLKEITLNPNETPAEALMRYNAESIQEALAKANQQPMEISTGGEQEEVKEANMPTAEEHQPQHVTPQQQQQQLSQGYALGNNAQYMPVSSTASNQLNNGPYITYPVTMQQTPALSLAYNQPNAVYDPSLNQEGVYNNFIAKYNTPAVYSTNKITQNPFLSMYNSLESVPYIDDYSVANGPYQIANHNAINMPLKPSKSMVYQKSYVQPQLTYNHIAKSGNAQTFNKNLQQIYTAAPHITDYGKDHNSPYGNYVHEMPALKNLPKFSQIKNKNVHISRQPQNSHFKVIRPQETTSFENLMSVIKERLAQCCNECKDKILKSLDETLKQKPYNGNGDKLKVLEINVKPYATIMDKSHPITYRKPSREEDFEYKQWLTEMSEKGYDKNYLSKQHQRDYLKDGKLNLHIEDEGQYEAEQEQVFYKNNQSYKRETTVPETEVEPEVETEIVTTPIEVENNIDKLEAPELEEQEPEDEDEEHDEVELEEELEIETEKPPTNESKEQKLNQKTVKETIKKQQQKIKKDTQNNGIKVKNPNFNTTKNMETAESTTHSVYALRGQFRPHKHNPMPFALRHGKQFNNYKNINKLGNNNNAILKSKEGPTNSIDKEDKLEEILDILHDLSKHNKEKIKDNSKEEQEKLNNVSIKNISTITSTTTTTTPLPLTTSSKAVITPTANTKVNVVAETLNEEKPKKLSRRRIRLSTKNRKLIKKSVASSDDIKLETNKK